jgi:ParB/RepB/Spo0J family partition protein
MARVRLRVVTGPELQTSLIAITELGESLSALRLCEPQAVAAMSASLQRYGQLNPLVVLAAGRSIEVADGFKRLRAARELGWPKLEVRFCDADGIEGKIQIAALHTGRGLTELEEGWLVRSLYRDDRLTQSAIAERLGRHKSWVCRRLMLVEGLDDEVQAAVRLGLLVPRAAVLLAALPRGNQPAAMKVVTGRALTVRQTELLVTQLGACDNAQARSILLDQWLSGALAPALSGPAPKRMVRCEADWLATDVTTLHQVAARLQARLLATPLRVLGPVAAEFLAIQLEALVPVLAALSDVVSAVTTPKKHASIHEEQITA